MTGLTGSESILLLIFALSPQGQQTQGLLQRCHTVDKKPAQCNVCCAQPQEHQCWYVGAISHEITKSVSRFQCPFNSLPCLLLS